METAKSGRTSYANAHQHDESCTPLSVSGIFPHLAVWNHGDAPAPWFQQPECGIGAVVPWAGKLWFLTYTSHALRCGHDRLCAVSEHLTIEVRPESVGGTHACRMIHAESQQLLIGCYVIDATGRVRVIDRDKLPGRLTAVTRHLSEPAGKVYFYTQEGALYEVDIQTLEPKLLFVKPLPGWHAKGAYTAQGVLVVAHNGEQPAPSPFWDVDYADLPSAVREAERHLQTPITYGPEDWGVLGEWDGRQWRVVSRRQHNDVTGPGGMTGAADAGEPIWAMGWDRRSVLVQVRTGGEWTTYRLPKGSYTYDSWNGSYTEWPRFRDVGEAAWLATMHGTFFEWPATFAPGRTVGLRPVCTYQRYVPDFCRWGERLVLAGQDASRIGVPWAAPGHAHSNLQFVERDTLSAWGPCAGFGGVWRDDDVAAGTPSDPMLVGGYDVVCLHLTHDAPDAIAFTIEADAAGTGVWREIASVVVDRYASHVFRPGDAGAMWVRVRVSRAARATAYLHLRSARAAADGESRLFDGLARVGTSEPRDVAVLGVPAHNHKLSLLARRIDTDGRAGPEAYYELDESLALHPIDAPAHAAALRETSAIEPHVFEDAASLVAINADGRRLRLPKSVHGGSLPLGRDVREVLQERSLANLGGTFYEVPRYGAAEPYEQSNLPDYSRMWPIASHDRAIFDFVIWRGLLVLSGVRDGAAADGHVFGRPAGPALWLGCIDDLWKLGKPVGVGGPWRDTPTGKDIPSDPYLMTGFDQKRLSITHRSRGAVTFTVEIDFAADGKFFPFAEIDVPPKQTAEYVFPPGFQAHWMRVSTSRATVATAQLYYT